MEESSKDHGRKAVYFTCTTSFERLDLFDDALSSMRFGGSFSLGLSLDALRPECAKYTRERSSSDRNIEWLGGLIVLLSSGVFNKCYEQGAGSQNLANQSEKREVLASCYACTHTGGVSREDAYGGNFRELRL